MKPLLGLLFLVSVAAAEDLVVTNGRVFGRPGCTAVRVRGTKIEAVGTTEALRAPGLREVDAKGGLILPGFIDPHVHLLDGGLALEQVQLASDGSLKEALGRVERYAKEHPGRPWILGNGWGYGIAERGEYPTRWQLDTVTGTRPALLWSYDGHALWANTRALQLAGIGPGTPDPSDGRIVREADGKTPAGVLLEGAIDLAGDTPPPPSRQEKLRALEAALAHMLELGITSVDDIEESEDALELFEELRRRGELTARVRVCLPLDGDLDRYASLSARHRGPYLSMGYLKGFVDGVIESKTAYMLSSYSGDTTRGRPLLTPSNLHELIGAAHARGFQVALHAIGDAAVRLALTAYERVQARRERRGAPHRVEHIEVLAEPDAARFARLGVIASMQPYHAVPSGPNPEEDTWSRNLGRRRLRRTFTWRTLLDSGATLAFGSDWSVMSADPLRGVAVAATRRNEKGEPEDGWNTQQAISVEEALRAYTRGSARAIGRERELGELKPGYLADLVVLSRDVDPAQPSSFWRGRVQHVILGGSVLRSAP